MVTLVPFWTALALETAWRGLAGSLSLALMALAALPLSRRRTDSAQPSTLRTLLRTLPCA